MLSTARCVRPMQQLLVQARLLSMASVSITKNIKLISAADKKLNIVENKLAKLKGNPEELQKQSKYRVETEEKERPLALIFAWMQAKEKHVSKFTKFYVSNGFDVVTVRLSPMQLLFPVSGSQIVAADLLKFLYTNQELKPRLVHGFSVGGYLFGELLTHIRNQPAVFRPLLESVSAQIFDSAVDFEGIPMGLSKAVFPKSQTMQKVMETYIRYHMKMMQNKATTHYMQSSMSFHGTVVTAPALLIYSKADPVGTEDGNLRLKQSWEQKGIQVQTKCFENSPHVSHFYHHPEEYSAELVDFLAKQGLVHTDFKTCVARSKSRN